MCPTPQEAARVAARRVRDMLDRPSAQALVVAHAAMTVARSYGATDADFEQAAAEARRNPC